MQTCCNPASTCLQLIRNSFLNPKERDRPCLTLCQTNANQRRGGKWVTTTVYAQFEFFHSLPRIIYNDPIPGSLLDWFVHSCTYIIRSRAGQQSDLHSINSTNITHYHVVQTHLINFLVGIKSRNAMCIKIYQP